MYFYDLTQFFIKRLRFTSMTFAAYFRVQKGLMEQEGKKQEADATRRHTHAEEVRKQVREKEAHKQNQRKAFFEEGIKLDQEAKDR